MQETGDKPLVTFEAGLVTEAGPLNTPGGATVDEQNFHILIDASRKRRRGLKLEQDGEELDIGTFGANDVTRLGRWQNAGAIPDNDIIVLQAGQFLYLFGDVNSTLSTEDLELEVDLKPFATISPAANVGHHPVSVTSGNGFLIVTGRFIKPFHIEWTSSGLVLKQLTIRIRDFVGIEDGLAVDFQPATLSNSHKYNLLNRGWREDDITAYFASEGKYPNKAMLWHKGYARLVGGGAYTSEDGEREFNPDKMAAEPFPGSSAPQGHFLLDPFNTVSVLTSTDDSIAITAMSHTTVGGGEQFTLTTASAHGLDPSDKFQISGNEFSYRRTDGEHSPPLFSFIEHSSLNGERTATTGTTGSTIVIVVPHFGDVITEVTMISGGTMQAGEEFTKPDGYVTNERPVASAWYAGRVWLGGIAHPKLADRLMFSQIIQNDNEFGNMYQLNDPTSEELNQLLGTDGGFIQLPDTGNIKGLLPYQNVLLVLADNGVWEISGGQGGFTPDNIRVRKITDVGAASFWGFSEVEGRVLFVGTTGIFSIQPDEETGILYAISITAQSIQSEWSKIPTARARRAKTSYDSVNKQAWVLFDYDEAGNPTKYRSALCYDLRLQAWSKHQFSENTSDLNGILTGAIAVTEDCPVGVFRKVKFFIIKRTAGDPDTFSLIIADLDQEDYEDWDGTETQAYLLMGADSIENWHTYRQAPVVHLFARRTETGFTGDPPVAENPSSIKMRARWDWTDRIDTGKWGSEQQAYREEVYRHQRPWVPQDLDGEFDDGYPVVVTRNKVRGRGRALQLWFSTTEAHDAHIMGYAIRYKVTRRV